MTDERFDSLEKVDLAMEELEKSYGPAGSQDEEEGPGPDEEQSSQNRRSGGDRRTGQGGWSGPERRSGKDRRLEALIANRKPAPRKGKGVLALILALAVLSAALYAMPRLIRQPVEEIVWVNQEYAVTDYDVIVVGAEPEGIAAAVAAARNGMNTLLLEESPALGGLMTLGQLNFLDMCHGRDGTLLTRGIFEEFYTAVDGTAFDITEAKNYFIDLVTGEPLLTLRTNARLLAPVMEGSVIRGVMIREESTDLVYTAKRVIDATADGDLAALAGAPFTYGGEDIGEAERRMGVTLVFELSEVNWPRVFLHLNFQRLKGILTGGSRSMGATDKSAWGYEEEGFAYVPRDPLTRLRGFNAARQRGGGVLINALLVFGVDPLDSGSYQEAIDRAKTELVHLLPYIRQNFAGFGKAELASTASRLYVRESRHFIGEYRLGIDDVLENRDAWDKIAVGGYPADVQPSAEQPFGTVIGNPDRYGVPFRCLVPLEIENLLLAGRSASYTSLAASSARVLPLGMVCGQAAGVAAAQSVKDGLSFRQMTGDREAVGRLQDLLKEQGAYLEDFSLPEPVMSHWAYSGLAALRRLGLADGGYQNDYRLEIPVDKWRYQYLLNGIVEKAGHALSPVEVYDPVTSAVVLQTAASVLTAVREGVAGAELTWTGMNLREAGDMLRGAGVITPQLEPYFSDEGKVPQAAEVMMLLAKLYEIIL